MRKRDRGHHINIITSYSTILSFTIAHWKQPQQKCKSLFLSTKSTWNSRPESAHVVFWPAKCWSVSRPIVYQINSASRILVVVCFRAEFNFGPRTHWPNLQFSLAKSFAERPDNKTEYSINVPLSSDTQNQFNKYNISVAVIKIYTKYWYVLKYFIC